MRSRIRFDPKNVDAFVLKAAARPSFFSLLLVTQSLPASNEKTMTELQAAAHQDPSEADLVQFLDAWSLEWKHKGRVRAVDLARMTNTAR